MAGKPWGIKFFDEWFHLSALGTRSRVNYKYSLEDLSCRFQLERKIIVPCKSIVNSYSLFNRMHSNIIKWIHNGKEYIYIYIT